ncbi:hypothetical protein RPMA_09580 [Tardiphaga alba]|uniref:Uncharacterized protein n=1 Tax=Tardiphaga alba TaxID=340268 RepID=A0ABX8A9I3_9BRAD|nr:hypothetical protein [Tardiphaga alba]QUS39055.1 hypothetical protein RPMA_09580 [Tardiphaga alba]
MSANDLAALDDLVAGQERGAPLAIRHPVTGEAMDIVLMIVGPDSDTAKRARLKLDDEKFAFTKRPPADEWDRMYVDYLARLVISWVAKRDGVDVPFTFTNVVKLLRDNLHVREQVTVFAQSRTHYFLSLPIEGDK